MRRIFVFIVGLFVVGTVFAVGENVPTSKSYVDTAIAQKQDTIPANAGAAQVLTNTGVAGDVGTKNIYDSSADYAGQTDALVTAGTMNAAVQNAIDTEFECVEWAANDECLLLRMTGAVQLPSGYTALQYLQSNGATYIDLGQPIGSDENITVKFTYVDNSPGAWFGATDGSTDWRSPRFIFAYPTRDPLIFMIYSTANTNLAPHYYNTNSPCVIGTPYTLNWYGNPFNTPKIHPNLGGLVRTGADELYTPTRNAYLFRVNVPNFNTAAVARNMRIHYFRVDGKMDLVPARRDSDGTLGMYDTMTNTFFTNAGSGEFIAGPMIYMPSGQ